LSRPAWTAIFILIGAGHHTLLFPLYFWDGLTCCPGWSPDLCFPNR
jgi:hypothetical protein